MAPWHRRPTGVCLAVIGILASAVAWAEDGLESDSEFNARDNPNFTVYAPSDRFLTAETRVEGLFQLNRVWPDDDGIKPFTSIFAEGDVRTNINVGRYFSVYGLLRFERGDIQTSEGAFFDEVLYVQRLFGIIHIRPVHLYAGKIHPRFGVGWYATPGLYGTNFDSDYELLDKVGGGVRWDIRTFGRHRLTVEAFHTDNSFLGHSLIPNSYRTGLPSLSEGGVGNTGAYDNFAVALNGNSMPGLEGLSYQVGWARQKASWRDIRDENSWSIAALWEGELLDHLKIEPMGEFVSVTGQAGTDRDTSYLTAAVTLRRNAWALALHTTQRFVRDYEANDFRTDSLMGIAVAYELRDLNPKLPWLDGFTAVVGFRQSTTFGISGQTLGAQIKYAMDF